MINIAIALCYYFVGPLFPLFLETLQINESQIGLILGIGSLTGAFSTLVSGYLADRFGKKALFFLSLLSYSGATLLISSLSSWVLIIPVWMVFNMAQSMFEPVRLSYIGEKATPDNQGKLYGFMNLAWPIAGILGPYVSGKLAESMGWNRVFLVAVIVCASGIIPLLGIESSSATKRRDKAPFDRKYLPALGHHFLFHLLLTTAIGIMGMAMPIYLSNRFELTYSNIGLFFTVSSILTMLTQLPSGVLADKYGMKRMSLMCLSIVPFTYLAWVFVDNWVVLLLAYAMSMGLWSMTWGATTVLATEAVPDTMRGTAISIRMTGYRIGYTLGPIIAGTLLTRIGGVTPFIAATAIFVLAIPLGLRFKETKKDQPIPVLHAGDD